MAVVQSSAPRHLYYVLAALLGGSAPLVGPACSETDPEPAVQAKPAQAETPARTAPTPPAAPAPRDPPADPRPQTAPAASDGDSFHLDDPEVEYEVPRRPSRARKGRPIEIVLRSSPPGAIAAVDGATIGATPAIWEGLADTTAREFTFVLPGYAIARYRFVPTQSGIVHGTLEPIKTEEEDVAERNARDPAHRTGGRPAAP
jgi:hypothetical protein